MGPLRFSAKKFWGGLTDKQNLLPFIRHILKKCILLKMEILKVFKTLKVDSQMHFHTPSVLMKFSLLRWLALLVLLLVACDTSSVLPTITPTRLPFATFTPSATVTLEVLQEITSSASQMTMYTPTPPAFITSPASKTPSVGKTLTIAPTLTTTPYPTWTPIPTFTPAPEVRTPAPPAECPGGGTPMTLTLEDLYTPNMEESIRAYLNAHGSAVGLEVALNSLINNADPPVFVLAHVYAKDVTGDGVPDVVMDLTIPEVGSYATTAALVLTCWEGAYETALFLLLSPQEGIYPAGGYQVLSVEDMNGDGIREVVVVLKVFDNRRYYILAWDGTTFTSLIEPRFDEISLQTVYYVEAYGGEGAVMDTDSDGNLELVITYNEEPIHSAIWAWNGYAFVLLDK